MEMRQPKRLLVIEKLVVAVPDDYGSDPNKITIDEALALLLQQRQTAKAVLFNRNGNYVYFNAVIPEGINLDDPTDFNSDTLVGAIRQTEGLDYAGLMFTVVYDEDLHGYRNIYTPKEEAEFLVKKAMYLKAKEEAEHQEDASESIDIEKGETVSPVEDDPADRTTTQCFDCDHICDEDCPDDGTRTNA